MNLRSTLEHIGFEPKETALYLASLETGESTVADLAKKTGMPRTSVEEILERMHKRGLINYYIRRHRKYWVAESPEKIRDKIYERGKLFNDILPKLQLFQRADYTKPEVKTFIGKDEIKLIMDDILETKHHISAIVSWDEWAKFFGDTFPYDFIEKRYKHFLKIKLIAPRTPLSLNLKKKDDKELRSTRFLPPDIVINNSNFLYGNKVAMISLNEKQPTGIVIEDEDIHHSMSVLFDALWQLSIDHVA